MQELIGSRLFELSRADGAQLFGVLDGARDARIYPAVRLSGTRNTCLYEGEIPEILAQSAPHMFEMEERHTFPGWILEKGWSENWGIFLTADLPLRRVRRHLRTFLMVKSPENKTLYFRYYDPRVFRLYLPTCTQDELDFVFGPVKRYMMENESGDALLSFRNGPKGLITEEFPLPPQVQESVMPTLDSSS